MSLSWKNAREEIINSDVLIIGGGIAGCLAAIRAKERGLEVVLAEKANLGRSGDSQQMSGVLSYFDPEKDEESQWYEECLEAGQGLSDRDRLKGMVWESTMRIRELENWGVKFQKANGEFIRRPGMGHHHARNVFMTDGGWQLMSVLRGEVLRRGVKLVERVMVTDLLTSDGYAPTKGRVVGAVGFHTRTGAFYQFKARAVVIASGSTQASIACTLWVPSLSGDGKGMAWRAGAEMRNVEMAFIGLGPTQVNAAPGANPLFGEGAYLLNARGERFMQRWDPRRMERAPRAVVGHAIVTEEREGKGPVCLDARHFSDEAFSRIEKAIPIVIESLSKAGRDLKRDLIQYSWTMTDHGPGGVRVDAVGATTVEGLFCGGAASDHAEDGVSNIITHGMEAAIGGSRAGEAAAKFVLQTEDLEVKPNQVQEYQEKIFAPLGRENGFDRQAVLQRLTVVKKEALVGPVRNKSGLKQVLELVAEIRKEDLPRIAAGDYHELTRVLGLENELLFIELVARTALFRTESRGSHFREDYPQRDDQNWLKWVITRKENETTKLWAEDVH